MLIFTEHFSLRKRFYLVYWNVPNNTLSIFLVWDVFTYSWSRLYEASNAAVKLLTEALYAELLHTNVNVSVVFPGAIGTNISENSGSKIPNASKVEQNSSSIKTMNPAMAAEIIISGIEKKKVRIFVGNDSKFLNYLYRLFPGFATRFIGKQIKSLLPN